MVKSLFKCGRASEQRMSVLRMNGGINLKRTLIYEDVYVFRVPRKCMPNWKLDKIDKDVLHRTESAVA